MLVIGVGFCFRETPELKKLLGCNVRSQNYLVLILVHRTTWFLYRFPKIRGFSVGPEHYIVVANIELYMPLKLLGFIAPRKYLVLEYAHKAT